MTASDRHLPTGLQPQSIHTPSQTSLTTMIKYRSRLRILLITFVAGVFLTNAYARLNTYIDAMTTEIPTIKVDELHIQLPVITSDSPLIVRPKTNKTYILSSLRPPLPSN